jgi:uncharacterized membrane protein YkoI
MRNVGTVLAAALLVVGCSKDAPTTAASTEPTAAASAAGVATGAAALQDESPGLRAQVKLTDAEARAIALQRIPGGRIVQAKFEAEGNTPLYTYELRVPNWRGTVELEIHAGTGAVVSEEREETDEDDLPGRPGAGSR